MATSTKIIQHVKITNTSSNKVIMLDGEAASSVINQFNDIQNNALPKAYINYEDPATKTQKVLELCCVEVEQLPNTKEEVKLRECDFDCCEQKFFKTFSSNVNRLNGKFVDPKTGEPKTNKPDNTAVAPKTE